MEEVLSSALEATWNLVRGIEPARGKVLSQQVLEIRSALEKLVAERAQSAERDGQTDDTRERQIDGSMATIYARAAAVAIAAGDEANAERWLAEAERLSPDDDQRAEIAAARRSHERYRALVHGRNRIAHGEESAARAMWKSLTEGDADAIAKAAAAELKAPRPLGPDDNLPTLSRFNGIGAGFYGRRDVWADGSYATTHCLCVLWIPLLPLSAWRVRDAEGGYQIFAREQLSPFARTMRWLMPSAVALLIAVIAVVSYMESPERLARLRWDEALATAEHGDAEPALRALDGELGRDVSLVDEGRAQRAGAEVVRLSATYVASPFTADKLDAALRVVRRYQALPASAQGGPARAAIVDRLAGWTRALDDGIDSAETRLALLGPAAEIASVDARGPIQQQITSTRLAIADSKQAEWPLEALAMLVEPEAGSPATAAIQRLPNTAAVERADRIVARLCESPSLLLDVSTELDTWASATAAADLRKKATSARDAAAAGRTAAEAEGVTAMQLAAMRTERPWDQFVELQLARSDADGGNLAGAAARLTKLGAPGMMVRAARLLLAQITAAQGQLEAADAQLTALLGVRLQRFAAASAALDAAAKAAQARIERDLDAGNVPYDLRQRVEAAPESQRGELVRNWFGEQMQKDSGIASARAKYLALTDIVPVALASGTTKLRRAQAMSGKARDAMLREAERAFLAIRTEAEGQPSFRLALGEIYARLGKTAESDAEFAAVLAQKDDQLTLKVAQVQRSIGSVAKAKQLAEQVFAAASAPTKGHAATLLALLTQDDESEGWFRKADSTDPFVKTSLLQSEAARLERQGKRAECAAKYAEVAKLFLANAAGVQGDGHNNAAIAYERSFDCNSDQQALRDAVAALETAYRRAPENAIITSNLAFASNVNGRLQVVARHIDVRALRVRLDDLRSLIGVLLESPDRQAVLDELASDRHVRRAHELIAQAEVLAPNTPSVYGMQYTAARQRRDVEAAAAVLERARRAKALDVSEAAATRERERTGADEPKDIAELENTRARLDTVLAPPGGDRLDARTRGAGWYLMAGALMRLGLLKNDQASLGRAREAAETAMKLWPSLPGALLITSALIDEAGLESDAKAWLALRRTRGAIGALDQLVADGSPLAMRIRASKSWREVATHARISMFPDLGDVRLARLLGDPALEAQARRAFDDKLVRLDLELALVIDPDDPVAKQDLAYFERR